MAQQTTVINNVVSETLNTLSTFSSSSVSNSPSQKGEFDLKITGQQPQFSANITDLIDKASFPDRTKQQSLVNFKDGKNASIRLMDNSLNLSGAENTQQKLSKNQMYFSSLEEKHVTNRVSIATDEIIINEHKINPNLWEYADFREHTDMYGGLHCVGHFAVNGTILTPSWDERLKKYVLIRRLCRMPLFSPSTNVPEILEALKIQDTTKIVNDYTVKQTTVTAKEWYEKVKDQDKTEYQDVNYDSILANANAGAISGGGISVANGPVMLSTNVSEGLKAGVQRMTGQSYTPDPRNGCCWAAVNIASHYSPWAAEELKKQVYYVPTLVADAAAAGLLEDYIGYCEPGDMIIYKSDYCHVVVATGGYTYCGNSSSKGQVVQGSDFRAIWSGDISKVIRTGKQDTTKNNNNTTKKQETTSEKKLREAFETQGTKTKTQSEQIIENAMKANAEQNKKTAELAKKNEAIAKQWTKELQQKTKS